MAKVEPDVPVADEYQEQRKATCRAVAAAITECATVLWPAAWLLKDESLEGLSLVVQITDELAIGAITLYESDRYYAGGALVRQLIEIQYLLWQFAQDRAHARQWLHASPRQLDRHFAPSKLRAAAGLRANEYRTHCDLGGHPNPQARDLLSDHATRFPRHFQWVDLGQHLDQVWRWLIECLHRYEVWDLRGNSADAANSALATWKTSDPLATRGLDLTAIFSKDSSVGDTDQEG